MKSFLRTRTIVVASAVAIGAATAGVVLTHNAGAGQSSDSTISSNVLESVNLPAGYERPNDVAVAADGSAWFWSENSSEVSVFHWNPQTGQLTQNDLGDPTSLGMITGIQNAIAIDSTGTVWIGANMNLMSFSPTTGESTELAVPTLPTDSALTSLRPPELADVQAITAMSANASGDIAVAIENSNSLEVLDTATNSFTSSSLGNGIEATDVSYLADGTLGVAETVVGPSTSGNILIIHPDQTRSIVTGVSTEHIAAGATGFIANDDQESVPESGSPAAPTAAKSLESASSQPVAAQLGGMTAVLPSNQLAVAVPGSVAIVTPTATSMIQLPSNTCNTGEAMPHYGPNSTTTTSPAQTSTPCIEDTTVVRATQDGGIYIVPNSPLPTVSFISSASY